MEVKAGPQRVLFTPGWCHIALGADHGSQRPAGVGHRQAGDLPANALEWQLRAGFEALHVSCPGQHHHWRAGQQPVAGPGLPHAIGLAQREHIVMGQQANVRVLQLSVAQRRWVHPAAFGVEQPAGRQRDPGNRFGFTALHCTQQAALESIGELALAFGFLAVEGQLQNPARIPVLAALQ
ncbi:hypothetical protein D3C81_1528070 [compost metagenome]